MNNSIFKKMSTGFVALGVALSLMTAGLPAFARSLVTTNCILTQFGDGVLIVQATGGVNFVALQTGAPSGCQNHSIDTLKTWSSMAQASILSGKQLHIYYSDCGSTHYIELIDLLQ